MSLITSSNSLQVHKDLSGFSNPGHSKRLLEVIQTRLTFEEFEGLNTLHNCPPHLGRGRDRTFDAKAFDSFIDPKRPQVVVLPRGHFIGLGVTAMLAAQEAQANRGAPNFIFTEPLPEFISRSNENPSSFYCHAGVVIDGEGRMHRGHFPRPVPVDMVFAGYSSPKLEQEFIEIGVPLSDSPSGLSIVGSKIASKYQLEAIGIATPQYFPVTRSMLNDRASVWQHLKTFVKNLPIEANELAIKADSPEQGLGISFVSRHDIQSVYEKLCEAAHSFKTAFVEPRIISTYELMKQKSWKLRIISTPLQILEQVVTIDERSEKVSGLLSHYKLPWNYETAQLLTVSKAAFKQAHETIRKLPALCTSLNLRTVALDLVMDTNGKLFALELNGASFGGLLSSKAWTESFDKAIIPCRKFLLEFMLSINKRYSCETKITSVPLTSFSHSDDSIVASCLVAHMSADPRTATQHSTHVLQKSIENLSRDHPSCLDPHYTRTLSTMFADTQQRDKLRQLFGESICGNPWLQLAAARIVEVGESLIPHQIAAVLPQHCKKHPRDLILQIAAYRFWRHRYPARAYYHREIAQGLIKEGGGSMLCRTNQELLRNLDLIASDKTP